MLRKHIANHTIHSATLHVVFFYSGSVLQNHVTFVQRTLVHVVFIQFGRLIHPGSGGHRRFRRCSGAVHNTEAGTRCQRSRWRSCWTGASRQRRCAGRRGGSGDRRRCGAWYSGDNGQRSRLRLAATVFDGFEQRTGLEFCLSVTRQKQSITCTSNTHTHAANRSTLTSSYSRQRYAKCDA